MPMTRRRLAMTLASLAAAPPLSARAGPASVSAFLASARAQIGVTTLYDPSYRRLDYPMGDVPADRGVCTDVVVRAYRGIGIDLQQRVHEDMAAEFGAYPRIWGLTAPDRNIDHRRVPNLQTYFSRKGAALGSREAYAKAQAGDLLTWMLPGNLPHIGIVDQERSALSGLPYVVHNIGRGAAREDAQALRIFDLTGRYRYGLD
ncbi:MAG: DUF1287 domain-containing protein [Alphaproteobacteria bacterium]|nr:DUF1287 domain-containing protein [Alphaproteobacteria bacterium]